jgi:hypothetical protein
MKMSSSTVYAWKKNPSVLHQPAYLLGYAYGSASANTWSIIAKTDRQNSLPIIPDFSRVANSR